MYHSIKVTPINMFAYMKAMYYQLLSMLVIHLIVIYCNIGNVFIMISMQLSSNKTLYSSLVMHDFNDNCLKSFHQNLFYQLSITALFLQKNVSFTMINVSNLNIYKRKLPLYPLGFSFDYIYQFYYDLPLLLSYHT